MTTRELLTAQWTGLFATVKLYAVHLKQFLFSAHLETEEMTFADLVEKRDIGDLVIGQKYKVTDHVEIGHEAIVFEAQLMNKLDVFARDFLTDNFIIFNFTPSEGFPHGKIAEIWNPLDFPLTNGSILIGNSSGRSVETPTVTTSITVGDFTGAYAGLAVESNWSNNFTNAVTGNSGDFHFGVGENGTSYYAYYSQSGWNRVYSNSFLNPATTLGLAVQNALLTTANWTSGGYYYNHTSGDVGQQLRSGLWLFTCIDGVNHTWVRSEQAAGYIITTDTTYIPFPQIEVNKDNVTNNTFVIPSSCDIISIIVVAETTTAGNISIGSSSGLSDVVASTALPITVGISKQLICIKNVNYPTASNRTLYINIDSSATVTLKIVNQKML